MEGEERGHWVCEADAPLLKGVQHLPVQSSGADADMVVLREINARCIEGIRSCPYLHPQFVTFTQEEVDDGVAVLCFGEDASILLCNEWYAA